MKLSTRTRGQIAVLKVQLKASEKELSISMPINNDLFYDIVLDNHKTKKIYRGQIKYCNRRHSNSKNLELDLQNKRSKRIHYSKSDIDLLLVYLPEKDIVLKYEQEHFHKKRRLTINLSDVTSKWYYKNFIWE